jgi:hypothetical protein
LAIDTGPGRPEVAVAKRAICRSVNGFRPAQCFQFAVDLRCFFCRKPEPMHPGVDFQPQGAANVARSFTQQLQLGLVMHDHLGIEGDTVLQLGPVVWPFQQQQSAAPAVLAAGEPFAGGCHREHPGIGERLADPRQPVPVGVGLDDTDHLARTRQILNPRQIVPDGREVDAGDGVSAHC